MDEGWEEGEEGLFAYVHSAGVMVPVHGPQDLGVDLELGVAFGHFGEWNAHCFELVAKLAVGVNVAEAIALKGGLHPHDPDGEVLEHEFLAFEIDGKATQADLLDDGDDREPQNVVEYTAIKHAQPQHESAQVNVVCTQ